MKRRLDELIDRCIADRATTDDRKELTALLSKENNRDHAKDSLLRAFHENKERVNLRADARDAVLASIYDLTSTPHQMRRSIWRRQTTWRPTIRQLAVAASVLVFFSVSLFLYFNEQAHYVGRSNIQAADIAPASNNAILTLPDGRTILLDDKQEGIVINTDVRYLDGTAVADGLDESALANQLMTLSTPPGRQYSITLPDGSIVWMNAASSLRYPRQFSAEQRKVELEGEAYFEVAQQADHPFLVRSKAQVIEVLGTHFNVNAYENERETRTTLVEGKVRIIGSRSASDAVTLQPGQQAVVIGQNIRIAQVDVTESIAWKDGRFDFNGKNLEQVMRELARWYEIEVSYEGIIPPIQFWGGVFRDQNLGTVLEILETNKLNYRLEGDRKLVIYSSN